MYVHLYFMILCDTHRHYLQSRTLKILVPHGTLEVPPILVDRKGWEEGKNLSNKYLIFPLHSYILTLVMVLCVNAKQSMQAQVEMLCKNSIP
jgi:hypothetical protein